MLTRSKEVVIYGEFLRSKCRQGAWVIHLGTEKIVEVDLDFMQEGWKENLAAVFVRHGQHFGVWKGLGRRQGLWHLHILERGGF